MGIKMEILDENPFWTRFKENCSAICSFYNHTPSDEILDRFPEDVGAGYLDAPEKLIDEDLGKFIFFRYNILRLDWKKLQVPSEEFTTGWWLMRNSPSGDYYILWIYPWKKHLEEYGEYEVEISAFYYAPLHIDGKGVTNLGFPSYNSAENFNGGFQWEDGEGWDNATSRTWDGIFLGEKGDTLPTPKPPMLNWAGWEF